MEKSSFSAGIVAGIVVAAALAAVAVLLPDAERIFIADTAPPTIDVWYGAYQVYGRPGTAQQWINLSGTVSDVGSDISTLRHALNGVSASVPLSIGPDGRRLVTKGEFNIELDKDDLRDGINRLTITAADEAGNQSIKTVWIDYGSQNTWPLPYEIDWARVTNPQDVVHIVDGLWTWDADGIRTHPDHVGYDRLLAIGDMTWTDYEVTLPITLHSVDETAYFSRKSSGPGVGIIMRWIGHSDRPISCAQPRCGWSPSGGSNWYEWKLLQPDRLHIFASPAGGPTFTDLQPLEKGGTYWLKARVETKSEGALYSLKLWDEDAEEPANWNLQKQTLPGHHPNGSFLLNAHHVDVTIGDVSVVPVPTG
jgi:hypothetical protein